MLLKKIIGFCFLGALLFFISDISVFADSIKTNNSIFLLFGHQNNVFHSPTKKSDNMLNLGIASKIDYTDTNITAAVNLLFNREQFDNTADFTSYSIKPEIEYNTKNLILSGSLLYDKSYEDYEYGVSNDKDKRALAGLSFSAASYYKPKWYGKISYDFNKFDYEEILFTDRKTHNYSLLTEYNFFGKTYVYLKTGLEFINYEKNNILQDNKEYFLVAGMRGVLSDKVEGFADFTIKRKNYKSLTDITKALINFEVATPLTTKLKLNLGFNFDVCENYSGQYNDTSILDDNRYYELSTLKANLNYTINNANNIDFIAKFMRKNYVDIIANNKPVDKLYDLNLNYNKTLKIFDELNTVATIGARYFSKDITPVSSLYSNYEGIEIYTKLSAKF